MNPRDARPNDVAVIGMSGRFPGARNTAELWDNIRHGRETISRFTQAEVRAAGMDQEAFSHPAFVNAGGVLEDIELFDADFFGFNARDAEITDPQHRLFLECAWEALEDGGYDPAEVDGPVGVFGGVSMSRYVFNLYSRPDLMAAVGPLQVLLATDKDHLTTRTAYKLNLSGPAVTVQTACSTSLVAVVLAYQHLLDFQCDMALAGGVTIIVPQKAGYFYQVGGISSPDGHCRAFDAAAMGTVGGNGVGMVLLKRLEDALADSDAIRAVIRGAAVNNDGSLKVGYTAPSVEGQARVIALAQAVAEVRPDTIGLIEAHGTGTPLGDPIEVAALTEVFRASTTRSAYCALGSLKSNIGHLDCAAGVAGLIKTVLALEHAELPPSLHFTTPNPKLNLESSPFYVNTVHQPWPANNGARRAGISSFGIGGTNAHVVLEEAPAPAPAQPSRRYAVLPISARSGEAVESATGRLKEFLLSDPATPIADVAYTSAVGRRAFPVRRAIVTDTGNGEGGGAAVADALTRAPNRQAPSGRKTVFMFPGQGAQYVGMGQDLIAREPLFREAFEHCAHLLHPHLGLDLSQIVHSSVHGTNPTDQQLDQTALTQPALFAIEYAMSQVLLGWGVRPHAMIGHSIGEYVAACLAGVFSLEDALMLVAARGRLMQAAPPGRMLAVALPEAEIGRFLSTGAELASVNGASQCVVSGPAATIEALAAQLSTEGVHARTLATSHAFHSSMMTVAAAQFEHIASRVIFTAPQIPFLSNLTGQWITTAQATDAAYWSAHLCSTVRLGDNLDRLLAVPEWMLLEVGPGVTLSALTRQQSSYRATQPVSSTMRHTSDQRDDDRVLLEAVAALWMSGVDVDWRSFYSGETRRRVHLPTYPFERQRYWIDAAMPAGATAAAGPDLTAKQPDLDKWLYCLDWKSGDSAPVVGQPGHRDWLVLSDDVIGPALAVHLTGAGDSVTTASSRARGVPGATYRLEPESVEEYMQLLDSLAGQGRFPNVIVHAWSADPAAHPAAGFDSLLPLARALARHPDRPVILLVVSSGLVPIAGRHPLVPEKTTLLGPVTVVPQELPHVRCRAIDLDVADSAADIAAAVSAIVTEASLETADPVVAYRGGTRWVRDITPVDGGIGTQPVMLRERGVYLITGGLGGVGLVLAGHLARAVRARIVLVSRTSIPDQTEWDAWCAAHPPPDRIRRAIEQIRAIERVGGEVLVATADVADLTQMTAMRQQVQERFGDINGVIHAAGVAGGGMIQLKSAEMAARVVSPKVTGTLVLEHTLRGDTLDFLVLCSSLASILGGFGQVDYCAANAFLDAYAHAAPSRLRVARAVSIDWDTWQETGMAVDTEVPRELAAAREGNLRQGMTNEEGAAILMRALARPEAQVVVSTRDWWTRTALVAPQQAPATATASGVAEQHERPPLPSTYVGPRNEDEEFVAATWAGTLGVTPIGVDDDFFALGGHSLLAIQIAARLKEHFAVDVPVQVIFDAPTVAELTVRVQGLSGATHVDRQQHADIVDYVGQLSDEEVRQLLAAADTEPRP